MGRAMEQLERSSFVERRFRPGHNACPGCGSTTALRLVLANLDDNCIFFVPASCASLYFGPSNTATATVPVIHTIFAAAFAQAEGMLYGLRRQGREEKVMVWAGDGACYDIGLNGLSGVAARGADLLVFCNDNQGYQNTGGHESSATPRETLRVHDPDALRGRVQRKDLAEIIVAHRPAYVATACAAFPEDLSAKVRKAHAMRGFRFILLQTPCVTWGYDSKLSVRLSRLAVETGYFPLYEVEDGVHYRITHEPAMIPFAELAQLQKRFRDADLAEIEWEIAEKWADLHYKASRQFPASNSRETPAPSPASTSS